MEDIKNLIKKYIEKDDDITEINKQIKDIRKERGILEENIKAYMLDQGIAKIDIAGTTIRISKTKPSKKINKKGVMEVLTSHLEDSKAETIVEDIFKENDSQEDASETFKLERTKKKI